MSSTGRRLLETREGNALKAYKDTVGVWTIGYGHTHFDGSPIPAAGMTITQQQADDMLTRDLTRYEDIVNKNVKVTLTQNEFDALVSICYNVESALSSRSSIVKRLNAGDKDGAAKAIMLYVIPPEITKRRQGEQKQFLTPYPQAKTETVSKTKAVGTGVVIAGAAAASQHAHVHWYWIAAAAVAAFVAWEIIHWMFRKNANVKLA